MQVDEICNEPPAPDPPRTPPRKEAGANEFPSEINDDAEENEASEDDDEDESASVGSGKRRRVRRKWTVIGDWDAGHYIPSELDANILRVATERMEESGLVEWPSTRVKPTRSIGLWCLGKSYLKDMGQTSVETYYCPLSNRTKCPVQIRVTRSLTAVVLETSGGAHSQALCHANDQSKKLNYKQRIAVAKVVKVNPKATPTDVRRALHHLSPSGKITAEHLRSVRSVVKIQKKITMSVLAGGAEVDNTFASIAAFGSGIWFGDILRRHNDVADDYHFDDPHKVFCIGNVAPEAAGEEIFLNLANMWGILNLARAHESGWKVCMSGDGTGRLCSKQITLISLGVNSIPAKFNTLNYCIGPVENMDMFSQSWDGVKRTFLAVMRTWRCCSMAYNHCKTCPLVTHFRTVKAVKEAVQAERLIHSAKSDNTDLFRNFARSIGAVALQDECHGHGEPYFQYALAVF
jgi:hypothetical protein